MTTERHQKYIAVVLPRVQSGLGSYVRPDLTVVLFFPLFLVSTYKRAVWPSSLGIDLTATMHHRELHLYYVARGRKRLLNSHS